MSEFEEYKELYILLGKNIAKARKAKSMSQNALSEKLKVSREHLAKIERAKRGISVGLIFKICDTLNISVQDLFDFAK